MFLFYSQVHYLATGLNLHTCNLQYHRWRGGQGRCGAPGAQCNLQEHQIHLHATSKSQSWNYCSRIKQLKLVKCAVAIMLQASFNSLQFSGAKEKGEIQEQLKQKLRLGFLRVWWIKRSADSLWSFLTVDAWLISSHTPPLTYICPTCVSVLTDLDSHWSSHFQAVTWSSATRAAGGK